MNIRRSKLIVPILTGLLSISAWSAFEISQSKSVTQDLPNLVATAQATENQGAFHPAPDFALKDLNGKIVHLSDFKGKVVVLNFWATWCPPCRKEIPDFNELQAEYGGQGVQFIGIALDDEGAAKVKPFVQANPISYPVLLPDNSVVSKYGDPSAIPTSFIIDREGNIRTSYVSARPKSFLEGVLKPLIAEGAVLNHGPMGTGKQK